MSTTSPAISASQAPRDSDRYIATTSSTAAPAAAARRIMLPRGSAASPSASTAPSDASAPKAFQ